MNDYLKDEEERWGDSRPPEPEPSLLFAMQPGDIVTEEYYKLLEAGCAIAALLPPEERAKFARRELKPVWDNWKRRTKKFTRLILEFEERLESAENGGDEDD